MKKIYSLFLVILIILNCFYPTVSVAADETRVDIYFKDKNLYNAIVTKIGAKISTKDDINLTITMTQKKIDEIKSLNLSYNQIKDISGISGLTNLEDLRLFGNQITDISGISGLTNLKSLNLADNQITDISGISGLTNLEVLYLSGNQITDISGISGLTNLEYLDLVGNQITDISVLNKLEKLKYIYLDFNKISDIQSLKNILEKIEDDNFGIQGQKFILELDEEKYTEIEMPDIFKEAKNEASRFYTDSEIKYENCEYDSNTNKIKIKNKTAKVYIGESIDSYLDSDDYIEGPLYATTLEIQLKDLTPPNLEISYSDTETTNKDVIVKITSNEEIQQVEGWELSEDKKQLTKTYYKNCEEEINVYDLVGNKSVQKISIKNINKETPKEDDTIAPTIIPKAGRKSIIISFIVIMFIAVKLWKKNQTYRDII